MAHNNFSGVKLCRLSFHSNVIKVHIFNQVPYSNLIIHTASGPISVRLI